MPRRALYHDYKNKTGTTIKEQDFYNAVGDKFTLFTGNTFKRDGGRTKVNSAYQIELKRENGEFMSDYEIRDHKKYFNQKYDYQYCVGLIRDIEFLENQVAIYMVNQDGENQGKFTFLTKDKTGKPCNVKLYRQTLNTSNFGAKIEMKYIVKQWHNREYHNVNSFQYMRDMDAIDKEVQRNILNVVREKYGWQDAEIHHEPKAKLTLKSEQNKHVEVA